MTKLYVFGDSFTTPNFCVTPSDSFWGLLAKDLGVETIVNYSQPGFSLDQIIHILCNEDLEFTDNYFFIGVPPIERLSVYVKDSSKSTGGNGPYYKFNSDFRTEEIEVNSLDDIFQFEFYEAYGDDKKFLSRYQYFWQEILVCNKLSLIYDMMQFKSAKFIIVNLTLPMCNGPRTFMPNGEPVMSRLKNYRNCILFSDTCHSVNQTDGIKPADFDVPGVGWYGHHGPRGNGNWYNKILKPRVQELGWI
jgi:hypothetical protein